METEATRALVQRYYDASGKRDKALLASLFTEDIEWYPPETAPIGPLKGRDAVAAALGGDALAEVFDVNTFKVTVHRTLADGPTAVVQQSLSAKTKAGDLYENEYCWIYHCRDGKIARIEDYADTLKAARILKWDI